MADLTWQRFGNAQTMPEGYPTTIASATTINPESFVTLVTGTINVATITPPLTGVHSLKLVFTDASPGDVVTTGNVLVGTTTIAQNNVVTLTYNPLNGKYYVG